MPSVKRAWVIGLICWVGWSGVHAQSLLLVREDVIGGLKRPWDMAFISVNVALVTEKEGGLQYVNLAAGTKQPIIGLPGDVDTRILDDPRDNSGLFGVALDPEFEREPWVYLAYSASNKAGNMSTTKVVRGRLTARKLIDLQTLLVAEPYSQDRFHYGGGLVFGADGKLYITVGERYFNETDQPAMPVAQDLNDMRGKIYRLNRDGSIPEDNPRFTKAGVPGVFAMGIRAAQGITLHPKTGNIWFSEHGARQGDEINRLQPAANYGWPVVTSGGYRNPYFSPPGVESTAFTAPIWTWPNTVAPTGLSFYYGEAFPNWRGNLLVAGLSRGSLTRLTLQENRVVAIEALFVDQPLRLRNVTLSPDGEIYLLTDERAGRILRLRRSKGR